MVRERVCRRGGINKDVCAEGKEHETKSWDTIWDLQASKAGYFSVAKVGTGVARAPFRT